MSLRTQRAQRETPQAKLPPNGEMYLRVCTTAPGLTLVAMTGKRLHSFPLMWSPTQNQNSSASKAVLLGPSMPELVCGAAKHRTIVPICAE